MFPSMNENDDGSSAPGADLLLFEAPDGNDRAVEAHLSGRDHSVAVIDVASELLGDVQCESEARRRAADLPEIDVHGHRQLDPGRGLERAAREHADDRPALVPRIGGRRHVDGTNSAVAANGQREALAGGGPPDLTPR